MEFVREETFSDLRLKLGQSNDDGGSFLSLIKLKLQHAEGTGLPPLTETNYLIREALATDLLLSSSSSIPPTDIDEQKPGACGGEYLVLLESVAPGSTSREGSSPGRILLDNFIVEDGEEEGYMPSWGPSADEKEDGEDDEEDKSEEEVDEVGDLDDLEQEQEEEEEEEDKLQALARMLHPFEASASAENFGDEVVAFTDEHDD